MRLNPNKCKEMIREHSFFSWGGGGGGGGPEELMSNSMLKFGTPEGKVDKKL